VPHQYRGTILAFLPTISLTTIQITTAVSVPALWAGTETAKNSTAQKIQQEEEDPWHLLIIVVSGILSAGPLQEKGLIGTCG